MFGDLNIVQLIGNITNDLNVRYTPNGKAVLSFGLATNRRYKVGEEWKDEANFSNIVVWGTDAEGIAQRARKGTRLFVQGRLQTRSWPDKESGKNQYKTEIVAERTILLDRFEKGASDGAGGFTGGSSGGFSKSAPAKANVPTDDVDSVTSPPENNTIDPDDLPF